MLSEPYCSVIEADTVNVSAEWGGLAVNEKLDALKWGRLFLDGTYSCVTDDGTEEYLNSLKLANALLGQYHAKESLFDVSDLSTQLITEKSVKAGSVNVSKKYSSGNSATIAKYDPYPDVTAALKPYCSKSELSGLDFRTVIR